MSPVVAGEQQWGSFNALPKLLIPPEASSRRVNGSSGSKGLLCGERLAIGPGSPLIVARITAPPPYVIQAATPGALLLVSQSNGQVLGTVATSSAPLDVIVASARS